MAMPSRFIKLLTKYVLAMFALLVVTVGVIAYGGYRYYNLHYELVSTQARFASSTAMFKEQVANLGSTISELGQANNRLSQDLENERQRVDNLAREVSKVTGTVGTLDKLSKIDPELLQKYSKVYFLNENYGPDKLGLVPATHLYQADTPLLIDTRVWPHLERLLTEARAANVNLKILSAFRSFGEQSTLKSSYKQTYGSGANQFSADQGYSEHQLGTTVDLTTPDTPLSTVFANTPAYEWLVRNAHRYGFILSYPQNNDYYQFEPWHWRFVGVELATKLFTENKHFYDLDQREIDTYLIKFFD